jgi:hypothetical protein
LVKYEENKRIKRQEIIFPLIKEFEECEKFKIAKLILDNIILDPTDPNYPNRKHWVKKEQDNEGKLYYRKINLKQILRFLHDGHKVRSK